MKCEFSEQVVQAAESWPPRTPKRWVSPQFGQDTIQRIRSVRYIYDLTTSSIQLASSSELLFLKAL